MSFWRNFRHWLHASDANFVRLIFPFQYVYTKPQQNGLFSFPLSENKLLSFCWCLWRSFRWPCAKKMFVFWLKFYWIVCVFSPVDKSILAQVLAWHRIGDKPLSEPTQTWNIDARMRHNVSMWSKLIICKAWSRPYENSRELMLRRLNGPMNVGSFVSFVQDTVQSVFEIIL